MITTSKHPTGGTIAMALVLDPKTRLVWTEWNVFKGTKKEVKSQFREHLAKHGLVLVNG